MTDRDLKPALWCGAGSRVVFGRRPAPQHKNNWGWAMGATRLPCTAVLIMAAASVRAAEPLDAERCRELGFAPSLQCSMCAKLEEHTRAHTGDDALIKECEQCCNESAPQGTFARATVDVCK